MLIGFGEFKGRDIRVPKGLHVRPATSQVREFLVNILGDKFPDARVLDLFSGSGALGIQALSVGAASVEFVEMGNPALKALFHNITTLGIEERVRVRRRDVLRHLQSPPAQPFDVILIDPPYKMLDFQGFFDDIELNNWVAPGGTLFIEHPVQMELLARKLLIIKEKKFGNSVVKIFERPV